MSKGNSLVHGLLVMLIGLTAIIVGISLKADLDEPAFRTGFCLAAGLILLISGIINAIEAWGGR